MNSIVAIGGPTLFRVIDVYRKLAPCEVWALGIKTSRDANDPLLRSLEALLEPLMEVYFAGEAQVKLATIDAELMQRPLSAAVGQAELVNSAVKTALEPNLASALSLIEMLDRAHVLSPIELVVTDESSVSAQVAVAWARARSLPTAMVPSAMPLARPEIPDADCTFVIGERAQRMYAAAGIDARKLVAIPSSGSSERTIRAEERAKRRVEARAAFTRVLSWDSSDVIVVFDPADGVRVSTSESLTVLRTSLDAIFKAFAIVRPAVPGLRLAIVTPPTPDGLASAGSAAAAAGIAPGDFVYAQTGVELWIAGADIIVSANAARSIEATEVGVPALNLTVLRSEYQGAVFAAEDGVIDAPPQALAAMIQALAGDPDIRTQIATIADDRLNGESFSSSAAITAISRELLKLRRKQPPSERKPKPDIVIWAPGYDHASGGIRALHRLCHLINLAGGNAWLHAAAKFHPTWNTPLRDFPLTDQTIVLVPEIVFPHPSVKRVIRWVLNKPGLLGGPKTYGPEEMVFYYAPAFRESAQAATAEILTDERELEVFTVEPELFFNDRSRPRLYDCVYIGKGEALYRRVQPRAIRDGLIIRRDQYVWPQSREETAALLRGCRNLYSFDHNTAIVIEAITCGARAFYVRESGELEEEPTVVQGFVERYYNISHIERFLDLVTKRKWAQ